MLTPESQARWDVLLAKIGGTCEDVMANALRLYEDAISQAEQGNQFLLKKPDRTLAAYPVFG